MFSSFTITALVALLSLSSLVSAQVLLPPSCASTIEVITITRTYTTVVTTTTPHSCYTATISHPAPRCPGAVGICITPDCIVLSTLTAPCKDACCPTTPTVTIAPSCTTGCREGCGVDVFTTTLSSGCPNPP